MKKNILLLGTNLFSMLILAQENPFNWKTIEYADSVKLEVFEILLDSSFDSDRIWNREFSNGKAIILGFGEKLNSEINRNYQLRDSLIAPFLTYVQEGIEERIIPGNTGIFQGSSDVIDFEEYTLQIMSVGYRIGVQIFIKNGLFEARFYKRERRKETHFFYPKTQKLVLKKEPSGRIRGILTGKLEGVHFESKKEEIPIRIEIDFQKISQ